MEDTERRVWILARELSFATWFPPLVGTSESKFHLCHWAVLITPTQVSWDDIISAWNDRTLGNGEIFNERLGVLYELNRVGSQNTVNVISCFGRKNLRSGFGSLSVEFIGTTNLCDRDIANKGAPLVFSY